MVSACRTPSLEGRHLLMTECQKRYTGIHENRDQWVLSERVLKRSGGRDDGGEEVFRWV